MRVASCAPLICALAMTLAAATRAEASLFSFYGRANGGEASGTMDFSTTGPTQQLVIKVQNISNPDLVDSPTGSFDNYPGIAAFGFDVDDTVPTVTYWSLTAYDKHGALQTIGSTLSSEVTVDIQGEWTLATQQANVDGIRLDFQPNQPGGAQGLIYNPIFMGPSTNLGALPNFFSDATLTMHFSSDFTLKAVADKASGKNGDGSPVMRFQRVGKNQSGSLKLVGTPEDEDPGGIAEVPEPASLAIWGFMGAVGLAGGLRRRRSHPTPPSLAGGK